MFLLVSATYLRTTVSRVVLRRWCNQEPNGYFFGLKKRFVTLSFKLPPFSLGNGNTVLLLIRYFKVWIFSILLIIEFEVV